jgi:hypothetical protein
MVKQYKLTNPAKYKGSPSWTQSCAFWKTLHQRKKGGNSTRYIVCMLVYVHHINYSYIYHKFHLKLKLLN